MLLPPSRFSDRTLGTIRKGSGALSYFSFRRGFLNQTPRDSYRYAVVLSFVAWAMRTNGGGQGIVRAAHAILLRRKAPGRSSVSLLPSLLRGGRIRPPRREGPRQTRVKEASAYGLAPRQSGDCWGRRH